ncbi:hypothetical protein P6B95_15525 [Streptomyces atratus]|uniref:hypothetical protein n=1 Tax=Streptomyces atratus TaxID=1893 RepID=UPI001998706D|nr:hypothetical protein [Streptomyces atratus]WPW28658.1 hypothetical protein P6B95_15525 [Streptomyces atratus]GGT74487.1 hypothetical protein GCM10010207_84860 [Streptomyces atratus]
MIVAGDGIQVDGAGSPSNPVVITAKPAPLVVADSSCITLSGGGTTAAPLIAAPRLDPAPGNLLTCGPGGLLVAGGTGGTVVTGCGLTGDGSPGAPVSATVSAWPHTCSLDDEGGLVYCDSTGALRSEPRGRASFMEDGVNKTYPVTAVPAAVNTLIETRSLTIKNPDLCRPAFAIVEVELDVGFTLPPNSGASSQIGSNAVNYFDNRGSGVSASVHSMATMVFQRTIPPGATLVEPLNIRMGRGSGGATYNRIETYMRAFVFVL